MIPKDILSTLSGFYTPDPKLLALLGLLAPLFIIGGPKVYKWWQERRKKAARPGPDVQGSGAPSDADVSAAQLLDSWRRFLRRLPSRYQRSLLNFEHFVVMGAAASGKSRLLDTQSDWLFQMKQVAKDAPVDPTLPFYLGSGAVIGELPARYLEDTSDRCRRALEVLWRRLYRRRAPTVVLTVDVQWLLAATRDEIGDLSRSVRMKVNMLSAIRGRAIEVRVAFTHLDTLPGFGEAAKFWALQEISNRMPLAADGSMTKSLQAWALETQHQLSRALAVLSAGEYRKMLAFVRKVPDLLLPLEQLLTILFVQDPASVSPLRGGVYFCSEVEGSLSPVVQAHESGPGPDPARRHLIGVTVAASAAITYCGIAYATQYEAWKPAAAAIAAYEVTPSTVGNDAERTRRRAISSFTVEHRGLLARFPGFLDKARANIKRDFTAALRDGLLIPNLKHIALVGITDGYGNTLRWRRSIYALGIIHSDNDDRLGIRSRMTLWSSMTGLKSEVIEDYLANSDLAHPEPVVFQLQIEANPDDQAETWLEFPEAINSAMADKLLTPEEVEALKGRVRGLVKGLARFEYDSTTLGILEGLDLAADTQVFDGIRPHVRLQEVYETQFRTVMGICKENHMHEHFEVFTQLFSLVASTRFRQLATGSAAGTVPALVDDLTVLRESPAALDVKTDSIAFELAGHKVNVSTKKWHTTLSHSEASAAVSHFLAASHARSSIFFTPAIENSLPEVTWNSTGTDQTLFIGRARLPGRYTTTGFVKGVRDPVERLNNALAGFELDPATIASLQGVLRSAVADYAVQYSSQANTFLRSFRVNAPTSEALRVVLGQVAAEKSSFDEFVNLLDANTDLELESKAEVDAEAAADANGGKSATDKPDPAEPKAADGAQATQNVAATKVIETDKPAADKAEGDQAIADVLTEPPAAPLKLKDILSPLEQTLSPFEPWHRAVGARRGGAELTKYKEIAKQLLSDLSAIAEAPPPAPKEGEEGDQALETELSATGRASLAAMRADTGAYYAMAQTWAIGAGLSHEQRQPFLAPFAQLSQLGDHDIADVVRRVWKTEMRPLVRELGNRFPFNPSAEKWVEPDELTERFHPVDGKFFQLFRSYLEPLSSFGDGQTFRPLPSARTAFQFPPDLYPTVNAVAALSARLWDEKGEPRPLEVRVTTVPFSTEAKATRVTTVVHLNVGKVSIFNFNQHPETSVLPLDWTKDEDAQLALHVTDVSNGETSFPSSLAAPGKYWRFFRLLRSAKAYRAEPDGSRIYEWIRPTEEGGKQRVKVRIKLEDDPWQLFWLANPETNSGATQ